MEKTYNDNEKTEMKTHEEKHDEVPKDDGHGIEGGTKEDSTLWYRIP